MKVSNFCSLLLVVTTWLTLPCATNMDQTKTSAKILSEEIENCITSTENYVALNDNFYLTIMSTVLHCL